MRDLMIKEPCLLKRFPVITLKFLTLRENLIPPARRSKAPLRKEDGTTAALPYESYRVFGSVP
jgi:hypothetical protein